MQTTHLMVSGKQGIRSYRVPAIPCKSAWVTEGRESLTNGRGLKPASQCAVETARAIVQGGRAVAVGPRSGRVPLKNAACGACEQSDRLRPQR